MYVYYYLKDEQIEVLNTMDFCSTQDALESGSKESQGHLTYAPALGTEEFLACTHGHSLVDVSNPTLLVTGPSLFGISETLSFQIKGNAIDTKPWWQSYTLTHSDLLRVPISSRNLGFSVDAPQSSMDYLVPQLFSGHTSCLGPTSFLGFQSPSPQLLCTAPSH